MFYGRFLTRALGENAVNGQFDTKYERVKRSCLDLASQMRCPHHFKDAKVEMAGENFDNFSVEVVTCCEEFRSRVEQALHRVMIHRV